MGDTQRPIPDRLGDQQEQAKHLTRTGNGPTVENESELLAQVHGNPDMAGFYTGPELADEAPAGPADDEAVDQGAAAVDETGEGGESA